MTITVSISKRMSYIYTYNYTFFLNKLFLPVFFAYVIVHYFHSPEVVVETNLSSFDGNSENDCKSLNTIGDYKAKCMYLKSNDPCVSQGYIDYLYLFYCKFGSFPLLGPSLLICWLLVMFHLLANTTSEYFCPSLDNLYKSLRLSPTIAGVTLVALGNGANDVFSSLVSFQGNGTHSIGFNTVLGGVSFVSCVVVGIVSISISQRGIRVIKSDFLRDVCFLLSAIVYLFSILITGEINVFGAIGFLSMYVVYVIVVCVSSSTGWKGGSVDDAKMKSTSSSSGDDLNVPLLINGTDKGSIDCVENGAQVCDMNLISSIYRMSLYIMEMPLYLPTRLTIPIVGEENWSKPYAVSSVILAPLLLSVLWYPYKENSFSSTNFTVYGIGLLVGIIFGVIAFFTTEMSKPPRHFAWLAGGFVMSVTWSYILAQELVGLLVSIGYICGISPSILGLTVLAWGNSLGDLMTNVTMALNGGPEGAQIAISGCYAGSIFNAVVGLGLSLVSSTWSQYPQPVVIPRDPYLLETLAFLVVGLVWALVVLIRRDMKLDGLLGKGLLIVYFISLLKRLI
ncbi:cation/calcium exchanger 2-like [Gastrolobium bilobum]|uniref:cation/calcium exchanger 2-like n=1 Tax=Gastrolobium bilobum TaxID=150636 RepID=UPI002AB0B4C0|nr:cation/calcium exchanger 2-like [Gastrolobium bilobum]